MTDGSPRPERDPTEASVRVAFLEAFLRDRDAGEERSLSDYQARFPGFEETVGEEFAALTGEAEDEQEDAAVAGDEEARIGRYRLLRRIGEGGMGSVYLAEQTQPVRRRVALKLIKLGMDTNAVVRRFEHERQALALMDHPQIARVLDAGATEQGRPYFVMEHVEGTPLTRHCDEHRLCLRRRLELFVKVCRGVHHAHQKGILHRDLKPSNLLVATVDGEPVPKIIDFGLAKATRPDTLEMSLLTEPGHFVGTVEYMSPEQACGSEDIDTRSDIYSLGVVLFELLTGSLPFPSEELRRGGHAAALERIARNDPPTPSSRIASSTSAAVADRRHADRKALLRSVRGDLDGIVLKALEKDRERRYASAAALAEDVGRYLRCEPVEAARPSSAYRIAKFVRRYRVLVAASAAVFFVLLAGIVSTTVFAVGESRARSEVARQLVVSNIERGRALGKAGSFEEAEDAIWREHLPGPTRRSHWALWELYFSHPCIRTLQAHGGPPAGSDVDCADVAFTSDGAYLATLGNEGIAVLREADTLREVARLDDAPLRSMVLSRDDRYLACGSAEGAIRILDLRTLEVRVAGHYPDAVRCLDFHPDGRHLAAGGDRGATVWDIIEGRQVTRRGEGRVHALRFSPDGEVFATSLSDTIELWRGVDGPRIAELEEHPGSALCLAFTPDGKQLVSGDTRWWIGTWDVATGELLGMENSASGPPRSMWVTSDSQGLVYTSPWVIEMRSFPSLEVGRTISMAHARSAASPDGRLLAAIDAGGVLRLWERRRFGATDLAGLFHEVIAVAPGGRIAASGSADGTVRVLDMARSRVLATLPGNDSMTRALAFDRKGGLLAAATDDGEVRVWDLHDGSLLHAFGGYLCPYAGASSLDFHPRRELLAYSGRDGAVRLADLASRSELPPLRVDDRVRAVLFHASSELLAVAANDGTTTLWAVGDLDHERVATLRHAGQPASLDFSGDGKLLACGTESHEVEIWNVAERRREWRLRGHHGPVWTLAFRPGDPRLLVSAGADAAIHLWDVAEGSAVAVLTGGGIPLRLLFGDRGETLLTMPGERIALDLAYYEQHIAGNLEYQIERLRDELGDSIRVERLRDWAAGVTAGRAAPAEHPDVGPSPTTIEAWGTRRR